MAALAVSAQPCAWIQSRSVLTCFRGAAARMADRAAYIVTTDAGEAESNQLNFAQDERANPNLRKVGTTKGQKNGSGRLRLFGRDSLCISKLRSCFRQLPVELEIVGRVTP